jgi:hypothetical protein
MILAGMDGRAKQVDNAVVNARVVAACLWLVGCNLVFGVDEPELVENPAAGGATSSSQAQSTGATGGGGSQSSGGGGQAGSGMGPGGSPSCDTPTECFACCQAMTGPDAFNEFSSAFMGCGCSSMTGMGACTNECAQSLCNMTGTPAPVNEVCMLCVIQHFSNAGACLNDASFQMTCPPITPCGEFVACIAACG